MKTPLVTLISLIVLWSFAQADDRVGQILNVGYDGRAILINGSRTLLISGSIHYPRSTPAMWDSLLKQSVAAGINLIETYVFWDLHEPQQGVYNFDDNANLVQFLSQCKENGLFVNLRIGPYICGEWNYGGFPEWLREVPDIVFRDYNQPFMNAMQDWVTYVVFLMTSNNLFAKQGGPIILAQIENEYGWLEQEYGASGRQYAVWAANLANSFDVGVPWIMCLQNDIDTVINTCNGFYCESFVPTHMSTYPNTPLMWTENWPGWFQDWGQARPHRPVQDVMYASARWFAKGGTHMNYYMWHGGTNFGRSSGGPYIVTSYDYDVALDEYGYPSEPKYSHSAAFHAVLIKYAQTILATSPQPSIPLGTDLEADVYGTGGTQLAFLSNTGSSIPATVHWQGVNFSLPPWSVSLVVAGQVLYNTNNIPTSVTANKFESEHNEMTFGNFSGWWQEPLGVWGTTPGTYSYPPMQLDVTHDISDYLWYTTQIDTTDYHTLVLESVQNRVIVYTNDLYIGTFAGGNNVTVNLPLTETGTATLKLLVSTVGLVNYAAHMEAYTAGILGSVYLNSQNITQGPWLVQPGLLGENYQIYTADGNQKVAWNGNIPAAVNLQITWFKGTFAMPSNPNATTGFALDLHGMTKGMAWVNGNSIGRYWNITGEGNCNCAWAGGYDPSQCRSNCGSYSQRYYHVPFDWLQDSNFVVVFEEVGGDPSTISLVARTVADLTVQADEGTSLFIQCDEKKKIVSINSAEFGPKRTSREGPSSEGSCGHSSRVKEISEKLCLGYRDCEIPVVRDVLGSQCGEGSALTVSATCA